MKISQIILVVLLSAVIAIFLGMILANHVPDQFTRIQLFVLTMLCWSFLIVTIDLYAIMYEQRREIASHIKET